MAGPDKKPVGSTTNGSWGEPLNRALGRASDASLRPGNRLTLLRNGPEAFEEWLDEIGRAEKWVHLEFFQFEGDRTGRRFAEAIMQKAREGIHVRVLYDWLGSLMVPRSFWRELRRAGVDVRVVNPPALSSPLRVFERDHRKLLAVDGLYASTGGVSIADLWLKRSSETRLPYRDTSVGVRGPAGGGDSDGRGSGRAGNRPGAGQDARPQDPGTPYLGGRGENVDRRRLLSLRGDTDAGAHVRRPRRGGRPHPDAHASDQRSAPGGHALSGGLPPAPGGWGEDLRVRRPDDARQDHRRRRQVVPRRLHQPQPRWPRHELGDRPSRPGQGLRCPHGAYGRGGPRRRPRGDS